jgi:hypothetical protein
MASGSGCFVWEDNKWVVYESPPHPSVPLLYKDSDLYQLPLSLLRRLYDSRSVSLEELLKVLSKASMGRRWLWGERGGKEQNSEDLDRLGRPLFRREGDGVA